MEALYSLFEQCESVSTDSRHIEPKSLFFALRGANFDGNLYAIAALEAGAEYAVVSSETPLKERPDLAKRMFLCDNTLTALQILARHHRRQLALPIIAIAGSNGKTTTKELVARTLSERFETYATRGNLNNHIGVPLTLLAMTKDTEFGVVEMGASSCNEIALLCEIAEPNYGILTNIGRSHLEGFGGVEGIRRGKGELFDYLAANGGRAFVPKEDETLLEMAAERVNMATELYSRTIGEGYQSQLVGDYNRANIAAAVAIGNYFGIDSQRIAAAIESYTPSNNRSQEMITRKGNRLIIDCYNANPSSMAAAIKNFATIDAERRIVILGDMLELGEWSADEHSNILRLVEQLPISDTILVGEHFADAARELQSEATLFATTEKAAAWLAERDIRSACILLKGSRGIALEKLIQFL
ncbi:MAG: UDP-N-acetylmuramoyl-tripeptide--D-alanyl-D-alanine ligase [Alistipes sp.]|nr:UDP-N-acetylmuramoyl-tripeptide--D-alanyl-D-alanine ligase [Alistipes sp.]